MLPFDAQTALVVVDLQNDFADPAGSLAVAGGAGVIPVVNGAMQAAASAGAMVVATQDWHPESTPHFAKDGGIWPVHCVGGTWGAELHPDFELPDDAPRIRKGTGGEDGYCAFFVRDPVSGEEVPTELEGMLRERASSAWSWPAWRPTTASRRRRSMRRGWVSASACWPTASRR